MDPRPDTLLDPPDDETKDPFTDEPKSLDDLAFPIGTVLGDNYEIRRLIGRGGMSDVFEAYDVALRRRVAIKVLRNRDCGWLLHNEGQALAATRHPNLVDVFGLGRHDGFDYLVLEMIVGATLEDHLARRRDSGDRLPMEKSIDILLRLAEALTALHAVGVAHRDVKPGNIMLSGERVVLMDLGIGIPEVEVLQQERNGGTPYYMAPEAILGKVTPGRAGMLDLYAFGVIGFELLAGRRPYEAPEALALFQLHVRAPVPDLAAELPSLPPRLAALIRECMAKDPADRPSSAEAVLWELRSLRATSSMPHRALSVLIVDDDTDLATLIRICILQMDAAAEVEIAGDGEAALRHIDEHVPHLILVDLKMRKMNGVELCMHLRGSRVADRTTVVPMSSQASAGDLEVLRALGMTQFLPKGAGLFERLGEILGRAGARL